MPRILFAQLFVVALITWPLRQSMREFHAADVIWNGGSPRTCVPRAERRHAAGCGARNRNVRSHTVRPRPREATVVDARRLRTQRS